MMNVSRFVPQRGTLLKIGVLVFSTAVTLVLGEVFLRYQRPKPVASAPAESAAPPNLTETEKQWFRSDPPPLPPHATVEDHARRLKQAGNTLAFCLFNEHYLKNDPTALSGNLKFLTSLDSVYTFKAPEGSLHPPYRFPLAVTMPDLLTTNKFGFRGPEIDFVKPARTIRIACVGSSTTVSCHSDPYSYPEYLEHWLNLWSRARGFDCRFEVLNAARSGIDSTHIAAVIKYEVLPLDVDYVIYYFGSTSFTDPAVFQCAQRGKFKNPLKSWLERLEVTKRLHRVMLAPGGVLAEPKKPVQELVFPDGLDEMNPQRERLGNIMYLNDALDNLDHMLADSRASGTRFIMTTFSWLAFDGMKLDWNKQMAMYIALNQDYWPASYANMARLNALQNRVYNAWARAHDVDLLDVAGQMPQDTDLYFDGCHTTIAGTRVRAWTVFQSLLPILERDMASGQLPRPSKQQGTVHPYIRPEDVSERPLSSFAAE